MWGSRVALGAVPNVTVTRAMERTRRILSTDGRTEVVTSLTARQMRCAVACTQREHVHFANLQLILQQFVLQEESESQPASDSHSTGDDSAEDLDAEGGSDTSDDNADVKDEVGQMHHHLH